MLDNKLLITKVTTCLAYTLYLASKGRHLVTYRIGPGTLNLVEDTGISLALCLEVPIGATPISVGPGLSHSWLMEYGGGFYRAGDRAGHSYTVLFDLKRCKKEKKGWFRDNESGKEGINM